MLGLLRLMSGRRLLIVAVLAVLLLSGSAALRSSGARLLACGVSLQMSDPTGATGSGIAGRISGNRVPRLPPSQCLHEVTRSVTVATAWLRSHFDASQDRPTEVPLTRKP
jgi:hypothetical protein